MNWLVYLPFLPGLLWVGILLTQSIAAMRPVPALALTSRRPRLAVLIPAHNEAAGIVRTLRSLQPQLHGNDRLLVVADNCSDATAQVAAATGAEVIERHDSAQRGKGYALHHGLQHLASTGAPALVILIDADCCVEDGAINSLACTCAASGRPVQGLYLMHACDSNAAGRLREFAWIMRNQVRPSGCLRLGWPCQLMGSGMAFPWSLLATAHLASAHLVEDMQLGLDLARAGAAPLFCPQAVIHSEFPVDEDSTRQQRQRWEHGHLGLIVSRVIPLLIEALRRRNWQLLLLVLDMSVPPLALLLLLLTALLALAVWQTQMAVLGLALCTGLFLALLLAWWQHARQILDGRALLRVPAYVLAKLPLYIGFLRRRQIEWVRTKRN